MGHIQKLPNEVLLQIFSSFEFSSHDNFPRSCNAHCDVAGCARYREHLGVLANLCLVCKCMLTIAQHLLFRTYIKLCDDRVGHSMWRPKKHMPKKTPGLHRLIRTLFVRPELAKEVKIVITCTGQSEQDLVEGRAKTIQPDSPLAHFPASIVECFPEDTNVFCYFLQGREDAALAILLSLTQNVQLLDIEFLESDSHAPAYIFVSELFRSAGLQPPLNPPLFNHLRAFDAMIFATLGLHFFKDVLLLPNLKRLRSVGGTGFHSVEGVAHDGLLSKVERIDHTFCLLPDTALEALIVHCPSLESLSLLYNSNSDVPNDNFSVTWRGIVHAISKQSAHLRELSLDSRSGNVLYEVPRGNLHYGSHWLSAGSLAHFSCLEHLSMDQFALIGSHAAGDRIVSSLAEILPQSLETLSIQNFDWHSLSALEQMIPSLESSFPNLEIIRLWADDWDGGDVDPLGNDPDDVVRFEEIVLQFQRVGIKVEMDLRYEALMGF